LQMQPCLFFTFALYRLYRTLPPTHKATWKDEAAFWSLDDEISVLIFNNDTHATKRRQVSSEEKTEHVKRNTYQPLE